MIFHTTVFGSGYVVIQNISISITIITITITITQDTIQI